MQLCPMSAALVFHCAVWQSVMSSGYGGVVLRIKGFLFIPCLMLMTACASVPTQEMSDARQALKVAHDVGASEHAREKMLHAQALFNKAQRELESGDFNDARNDATAARVEAIQAQELAQVMSATKSAFLKAIEQGLLSDEATLLYNRAAAAADENTLHEAIRLANEARHQAEQDLRLE